MTPPIHPVRLAAALTALAAGTLLAACGNDSGGDAQAGDGGSGPSTVTVEIPEFSFDPDPVRVAVGDSIIWDNTHSQAHTATGTGDFAWNTGNIAGGEASEPVELTEAGTFTYICALHPFMTGTVEVAG